MTNLNPARDSAGKKKIQNKHISNGIKVAVSWSGGKDSCLACYRAIKDGYKVECLLNFISKKNKRGSFHGIESKLMNLQAKLMGIPLVQREVSPDMGEYEKEFKKAVANLKSKGIEAMVFGDSALEEHKFWVDRVCQEVGVMAIEPLWQLKPAKIANEFIDSGFKSVVVSTKAKLFGKEWMGHQFDGEFLNHLRKEKIDLCGENGEFHTFVVDGPIFKKRIEIIKSQPVFKRGFWRHWFLDILEYRSVWKNF